jgi:NADPH:quinone reductase-like Zn-dependent oxidoreductase
VKPDPELGKWSPHRRAAVADASGAGHFGPNPATNPNFTHPGHRPPGGADAAFDPVGGDYWLRSLKALTGAGMLVAYGFFGMVNEPDVSLGLADRW